MAEKEGTLIHGREMGLEGSVASMDVILRDCKTTDGQTDRLVN